MNKLWDKLNERKDLDPSDGFTFINSSDTFTDKCIIKSGEIYTAKLPSLGVLYRCDGITCEIREKDKLKMGSYHLQFLYRGYSLDHQNPDKPIQLLPENSYLYEDFGFVDNTIVNVSWKAIQYEEKRGVFLSIYDKIIGNNSTFYGMCMDTFKHYTNVDHVRNLTNNHWKIKDQNGNHFILLLYLENFLDDNCDKYTRKAKSFFDTLSNIFALGSTILHFFSLSLSVLFSTNFDNYKIIENILKNNYRININKTKEGKDISKIELKTDLIGNLTDESEEQNINSGDDKNKEGEDNEKNISSQDIDIPELKFYDFLFHKLYFKCFGPSSKHSLLNAWNDIVSTNITIEKLIYNQIKFDYLWKDYKWNNPQNEINERDDFILKLKEK